jgi:hypothetical protein
MPARGVQRRRRSRPADDRTAGSGHGRRPGDDQPTDHGRADHHRRTDDRADDGAPGSAALPAAAGRGAVPDDRLARR